MNDLGNAKRRMRARGYIPDTGEWSGYLDGYMHGLCAARRSEKKKRKKPLRRSA